MIRPKYLLAGIITLITQYVKAYDVYVHKATITTRKTFGLRLGKLACTENC